MKKVVVAAALLASSAASVLAAPPSAPSPGWTGSYGGIQGGWGWGSSGQTDRGIPVFTNSEGSSSEGPADGHYRMRGGLLGATLGSNWQKGPWVYGLEGDLSWSDLRGSSNVCGPLTATPHSCGTKP